MSNLTTSNPLDSKEALITVTVLTGETSRELRPIVVTVGIPEKQVTMKSGTFGQMEQLINQAWYEYAQLQVATAVTAPASAIEELDDTPVETAVAPKAKPMPSFAYDDDL